MTKATNGLTIALRLAARELRGGLAGFRILIACLALGVGTIAGVGSFSDAVVAGLNASARELLGGDVELTLHNRPADDAMRAWMAANAPTVAEAIEMRAMAGVPATGGNGRSRTPRAPPNESAPSGATRTLVELKAVDSLYPLVGALRLDPPLNPAEALAERDGTFGAVADPGLLAKLGVGVGARLKLGDATFAVRARINREPDRVASVVNFGPRFLIHKDALPATGLVQPGSRVHYHYRVLLPAGIDGKRWSAAANAAFPNAGWRARALDEAAPGLQRFIDRLTLFLTFVGLTVLLVGGIGVSNAVKSYLDGKTATIATLKCLGASNGLVFRTYLAQVLALSAVGIALGLIAGAVLPLVGLALFGDRLPVRPIPGVFLGPLVEATAFGLLAAFTFALAPLARTREVPAAGLFRSEIAPIEGRPRASAVIAVALGGAALAALTVLATGDRYFASWFVGGVIATLAVLRGGAWVLKRLAKPAAHALRHHAEWRLALANLHRPGAPAPAVVLSLGTGLAVLVAVALIQGNMSREINERLPEEAPAFFFIDIQPDQAKAFDDAVTAVPGTGDLQRVPSLRGSITKINGVPVDQVAIAPDVQWAVRGDRALTYTAKPPDDTRIVAGRWWPEDYRGPPLISFDAKVAKGFGVGVGDTLSLTVLGREITATIASLREIDWRSLRFDFAIIFAPGALDGAPYTHIAAVRAKPEAEDAVERAVAERFANVSTIRVREALEAAAKILEGVGAAVNGTASITILAGALVLGGTIAATRRRRLYDAVVFKVLGATRARLLRAYLMEFGVLGLAAGIIAALVGTLTAWAVVEFLMETDWVFLPGVAAATLAAAIAITVVAGFAGTWRALGTKAAPYLRNE